MDPERFPPNRIRLLRSPRQDSVVGEFIRRRTAQATLRGIEIEEVNVQAKQIKSPSSFSFYMPKDGNNVLTLEKLEEIQPINLTDALKHIPFITLVDGKIFITSLIGPALLIIDDMIINNVDDLDAIIDPSNIEQIGVLRGGGISLLGGQGAGGAIVITTRKGLSSSSIPPARKQENIRFINPLGLQEPSAFYAPQYETAKQRDNIEMDLRTTIYWSPDVNTSPKGEGRFEFYTADTKSTYSVVIEGVTENGQIFRKVSKIKVK